MIKNKKIVLTIVIVVVVLGLVGYWFFLKKEKPEFNLEKVGFGTVVKEISETGTVKISQETNLATAIFLIESGFFGLFGGLGGIILGLGLAKLVEFYFQIHPMFFLQASVTPQLILFGLSFSFLIGCFSGYLPARSASKLNPVDALRYE